MKHAIIAILILFTFKCFAQDVSAAYQFLAPVYDSDKKVQFKKGHKVYVTRKTETDVYFCYFKFSVGKNSKALNNAYYFKSSSAEFTAASENDGNDSLEELKTFSLPIDLFNNYTTRLYPRSKGVSASVFTVPFKLRINDFDFEQNVNIGMNLSFPIRMNKLKENESLLTPTIGIGLANISLNPKNSDLEASDNENENRSASAFSFSAGLMYQFNSTINFGLQLGFDYLGNNDKDVRWKYDRKPWIGIGINIGVSGTDNTNVDEKN